MRHEHFATKIAESPSRAALDRELLLADHMPMVRKIAWHVHGRMSQAIEIEDLLQIGFGALVEAARGFEDRGIDFKHYASTRVRGAMIDCLRREARMSRGNMVNRRKINAARKTLEGQIGGPASDKQMADALGVSLRKYYEMVSATAAERVDSLDEVYSDHIIWFADQADAADTLLEKSQLMEQLAEKIGELAEREALILQLYFVEEMNLDEIGLVLDIGAARVCQIKKSALQKLQAKMLQ